MEETFGTPISDILKKVGADWDEELTPQLEELKTASFFIYRPDVFNELKNFMQERGDIFDNIRLGDDESWKTFQSSLTPDEYGFPNPSRTRMNPVNQFLEDETNYPVGGKEVISLGADEMKQPVLDWYYLVRIMEATNHIFHPTYCGEQDGDWEVTQKLSELTQSIAGKREIWDEDEDFDEDDEL
jgi:hypothetical protein